MQSALAALDAEVAHQKQILAAGCIAPLVAMLKGGSAAAQAYAAQALANAACYDAREGQNAIAAAGAVPRLLILLAVGKAQTPAAGALSKLAAFNSAVQNEIMNAGGIAPLLSLLNGVSVPAQVQAAGALAELARENVGTQTEIAKAGGIGPLLALVASRSPQAQSRGMAALAQLAHLNKDNQDAIARMDGIRPLVHLLEGSTLAEAHVQAHAAFALMEITRSNGNNQTAVVDVGGIAQLASLMKNSQSPDIKTETAGALWSLAEDPKIKVTIAGAGAIDPLVQLLGAGFSERASEHAREALLSLGLNNAKNQVQVTQLLIGLLSNGAESAQERAVTTLHELVNQNPEHHDNIAKAGSPSALVELLKAGIRDARDYSLWSLSLSITEEQQVHTRLCVALNTHVHPCDATPTPHCNT